MAFTPGLVSITFRQLSPAQVLDAAVAAGLSSIEWGGDKHCPHGDVARATEVAGLTRARGLTVGAYGSYYRLGGGPGVPDFADVLGSAQALGAPRIRVWAGTSGSAGTSAAQRAVIVADGRLCAELAAEHGITVVSEWHGGTLTDTLESGRGLLTAIGHPGFRTVWQPGVGLDAEQALAELAGILPWLDHLHVFHWQERERRPLAEGAARWRRYLDLAATAGRPLVAAVEFVLGDDPAQLMRDGAALNDLLSGRTPTP